MVTATATSQRTAGVPSSGSEIASPIPTDGKSVDVSADAAEPAHAPVAPQPGVLPHERAHDGREKQCDGARLRSAFLGETTYPSFGVRAR